MSDFGRALCNGLKANLENHLEGKKKKAIKNKVLGQSHIFVKNDHTPQSYKSLILIQELSNIKSLQKKLKRKKNYALGIAPLIINKLI